MDPGVFEAREPKSDLTRQRGTGHASLIDDRFAIVAQVLNVEQTMRCPFCGFLEDKVVDSRQAEGGDSIRRRRECLRCGRRFTTYERVDAVLPRIIKSDGSRQEFDRAKMMRGLKLACSKRPISTEQLDEVADRVELRLAGLGVREVSSDFIGQTLTEELRQLDPVAYIRFASVYRAFDDIEAFLHELRELELREHPKEDS